ncbi:uncharacterized protein ARMOST_02875 [Armillaria ostoyae]|uniref:Uncharacterized protein n=1 Tax=Armillaria ostoyae TaxID=47428 RepID=A0A284QT09_ARMOS|nr:uncharacterized protein ARMOST_02875 [Armillaria ostoyae]
MIRGLALSKRRGAQEDASDTPRHHFYLPVAFSVIPYLLALMFSSKRITSLLMSKWCRVGNEQGAAMESIFGYVHTRTITGALDKRRFPLASAPALTYV